MCLKLKNTLILSWEDVNQLVDILCNKIITELPNIDSIFGLKRGGLIPAVMISHKLNIPWSDVMYPDTLIVDDICDTGNTLSNCIGVHTAVLHYKPHTSCYNPSIYAEKHIGNGWIKYPWETNNSKQIQNYLIENNNINKK